MEEMLGNIAGARQVFERWMEWQPEEQAWHSYINFELRYKEVDRARTIYERYILWWGLSDAVTVLCAAPPLEVSSWSGHTVVNVGLEVQDASFICIISYVCIF